VREVCEGEREPTRKQAGKTIERRGKERERNEPPSRRAVALLFEIEREEKERDDYLHLV